MTKTEQFWHRIHELTQFCLSHRGKCFAGWPDGTVFFYVAFHALCGTLFVLKSEQKIKAVGFAWPSSLTEVSREFNWRLPCQGECLVIMETLGSRNACGELFKRAISKWPKVKRFFAWRRNNLIEISPKAMKRFCLKGGTT